MSYHRPFKDWCDAVGIRLPPFPISDGMHFKGTQFLILTGKQPEGKSKLKWRFNVDTKTPETGKNILYSLSCSSSYAFLPSACLKMIHLSAGQKLSELRGFLIGDGTRNDVSVIPLVLFSTDRGTDERSVSFVFFQMRHLLLFFFSKWLKP